MTKSSPSNNLSSCHHAGIRLVGGVGDFSDHEEGITMHYECTACGEACDLLPIASNNLKELSLRQELASLLKLFHGTVEGTDQILNLIIDTILAMPEMQDEPMPEIRNSYKATRNNTRADLRAMLEGLK